MTPKQRRAELKRLMEARNLTAAGVAMRLNKTPHAVRTWLRGARNMPENSLQLLKLLLQG